MVVSKRICGNAILDVKTRGMHNEEERVSVLGASSAPDDYSK